VSEQRIVDLRSDTVTVPSEGMRRAIAEAPVGDDVYGEDPTVNRLEALSAELLGKEAALFVPSGTMANLLALLAHCPRGSKVLMGERSDIWLWQAGGGSVLGGLVCAPVRTRNDGELPLEDLEDGLGDPQDAQCAPAALICLENAHCMSGGRVLSIDYQRRVRTFAAAHGLALHLDGARLFNAAVALGVDVGALTQHVDSVAFCLSKGLGAPVGSVLAGSVGFIARARRLRKMLGGGMRQAGVLAAAGLVALHESVGRLAHDHALAARLAQGLSLLPGVELQARPQTNIVMWRLSHPGPDARSFIRALAGWGVRVGELGRGRIRAVTHRDVTSEEIDWTLAAVARVLEEGRAPGAASA
jgi:threonine aldolase